MAGKIRIKKYKFTESSGKLHNPGRGFYNLYRFLITDGKPDYGQLAEELLQGDENTGLSLIEINLQSYRAGRISQEGIDNINNLFHVLRDFDRELIVRFLYDWDGKNMQHEPGNIEIILGHMEQLEDVLQKNSRQIFILQGLFIGNWGEMNGTRYLSTGNLRRLADKLKGVTDLSVFLAVRTPSQWRGITGLQEISEKEFLSHPLAGRLGLYNDGMLGNESDYGTYSLEAGGEKMSGREAELDFQHRLCRKVPNGGEVIRDNSYNDFENAVKDLAAMHVTYLNAGYDRTVLDKWKRTQITEDGCYQGMDGYTYIERHLGYRLLISTADFYYNRFTDCIRIKVKVKNVGFAPLYAKARAELIVCGAGQDSCPAYEMKGDLQKLTGGKDTEKTLTLKAEVPLKGLPCAEYGIYLSLFCQKTGKRIWLANEQDREEHGYRLGTVSVTKTHGRRLASGTQEGKYGR